MALARFTLKNLGKVYYEDGKAFILVFDKRYKKGGELQFKRAKKLDANLVQSICIKEND